MNRLCNLVYHCAELRDDARELAAGEPLGLEHGSQVAQGWLDLAGDLAAITSHTIGEYVGSLDHETQRVIELAHTSGGAK